MAAAFEDFEDLPRIEVGVTGGQRMSLVDAGPRDADPVVLVHGNPAHGMLWRKVASPLLLAGHRVIIPDHVGFGRSSKPRTMRYHRLETHVDNLAEVLRTLDLQRASLVLHDWGGPIGMGAAVAERDRIARIVVTNTTAFAPTKKRALSKWHAFFSTRRGRALAIAANLIPRSAWRLGANTRLPSAVVRAYLRPTRSIGGRLAPVALVAMVPDGPDHPSAATLRSIEAGMAGLARVPTLVLWADRDKVFKKHMANRWLDSPLDIVDVRHVSPSGGHFWQEDDPEPFVREMLPFLSSRASEPSPATVGAGVSS